MTDGEGDSQTMNDIMMMTTAERKKFRPLRSSRNFPVPPRFVVQIIDSLPERLERRKEIKAHLPHLARSTVGSRARSELAGSVAGCQILCPRRPTDDVVHLFLILILSFSFLLCNKAMAHKRHWFRLAYQRLGPLMELAESQKLQPSFILSDASS